MLHQLHNVQPQKAGEGGRTLDIHVGNMPWSMGFQYQKLGFALQNSIVLHYISTFAGY